MPSPFPGMDPYLEDPGLWPDVHHELLSVARELLNIELRPKYHVRVEERVYVSDESDPGRRVIVPDLRIAERPGHEGRAFSSVGSGGLEVAEPVIVTTLMEEEIHEAYLEVIDRKQRQVVTVIEIQSPTNKVTGARGQGSYLGKRTEVLRSPSHFVEIDLLRRGARVFIREVPPECDYFIHVSRAHERPKATVWPIRLHQRLPVIPIPLRGDDPDAHLDLQTVLSTAYDRAAYDMEVDYAEEPDPPLEAATAEWAHQLLASKGLR